MGDNNGAASDTWGVVKVKGRGRWRCTHTDGRRCDRKWHGNITAAEDHCLLMDAYDIHDALAVANDCP